MLWAGARACAPTARLRAHRVGAERQIGFTFYEVQNGRLRGCVLGQFLPRREGEQRRFQIVSAVQRLTDNAVGRDVRQPLLQVGGVCINDGHEHAPGLTPAKVSGT
jgi:hypothetical protein